MPRTASDTQISASEIVRRTKKWQTSVSWPSPIDQLLDQLVNAAIDAGEGDDLSRSEVLAALVSVAPRSGHDLRRVLDEYRQRKVSELWPERQIKSGVLRLPARKPGRRPTKGAR
jgi:hypothetical protein